MIRLSAAVVGLFFVISSSDLGAAGDPFAELVRTTEPLSAVEEAKKFHLPPGFSIDLIASEPVVNKPMNLAVDEKGRLWVTSSAEYPWAVKKENWRTPEGLLESSKDKILVFSDSNGDGIPDKPTVFADNLNIPTGVLPYGSGCIAWSIPNIWYFEDADGDGKCDRRTILFGPLGWERDTHGNLSSFRLAPDGWVYATHGFSNTTHIEVRPEHRKVPVSAPKRPTPNAENWKLGPDQLDFGYSLDLNSGNVFRFRPDGSRVEIWAWGQVNPFGLTWDRWGNLYSADCHTNPITQIIREAFYPSFGKPDGGLGFGPVLCEHSHGSTGICAPLYIDRGVWGPEYDDHMLVCNPVTSRINHDKITYTGATPKANELPDFLTTDDPWFHPVDIRLAPDGSMYVADFYNRIIGHYEVPLTHPGRDRERGRIWRVAKKGASQPRTLTDEEILAQSLRFEFGGAGKSAVEVTAKLKDASISPLVERLAVEAAAAAPDAKNLSRLLSLTTASQADPSLLYTLRIALRNTLRLPGALKEIGAAKSGDSVHKMLASIVQNLSTPEAATWLLGYLQVNPRESAELDKLLGAIARILPASEAGRLAELVRQRFPNSLAAQLELFQGIRTGLAQRGEAAPDDLKSWGTQLVTKMLSHEKGVEPEWNPTSGDAEKLWRVEKRDSADGEAENFLTSLPSPRGGEVEKLIGTLTSKAFLCPPALAFWLCGHRGYPNKPPHDRNFVRLVEVESGRELAKEFPPRHDVAKKVTWDLSASAGKVVRMELTDGDNGDAYAWLAAGRFDPEVITATDAGLSSLRLVSDIVRDLKLENLAAKLAPFFTRPSTDDSAVSSIAQTLVTFPSQAKTLGEIFKSAPSRLQRILAATMAGNRDTARQLCDLADPRLLTQPGIASRLAALNDSGLNERIKALTRELPPASAEAALLVAARLKGFATAKPNAAAGELVFQTNCAICHKIGDRGNIVGPQLDGAGNRGAERLCEDILDPNRAVDPAFHLRIIKLKSGNVLSGLQRRIEGETIVLADVTGKESTIGKSEVTEIQESPLSLMPAAFGQSIPEDDFYNLLAWLLEKRAAAK